MESRMDRYESSNTKKLSRSIRNQELYERLDDLSTFTSLADVRESNTVVLDATKKNYRTREGYQKLKDYSDIVPKPKIKKELDDLNNLYKIDQNKVYDINSVIEEAKKNRKQKDQLEEKRKLKNTSYNILFSLDSEKLEEFKKNRNKVIRADSEEFKEILNTITTKAINGEIDKETSVNLLSDLMATQQIDMVEGIKITDDDNNAKKELKEDIDDEDSGNILNKDVLSESDLKLVEEKKKELDQKDKVLEENNQSKNIFKDMDQSFYTRSMDLSDKDFDVEIVDDDAKPKHSVLKIFFTLFILAIIGILVYYVLKKGI